MKNMVRALAIPALFLTLAGAGLAQQSTFMDPLLDHFIGTWILRGTIAGQATVHDISAQWVVGHQYVRIDEVSRDKNDKGQPAYEACVFVSWYQPTSEYVCVWLDTYGGIATTSLGHAKKNGDEIAFLFDYGEGNFFHTVFAYDRKTDTWEWRMDNDAKGTLKPFARVKLTRK